jgi:NTE family protein
MVTDAAPRIGLVLGAGGVAGGAFHAGALAAVAEATGWDPRTAAVVVGTSAGSIAGAGLRAGLSADDALARAVGRPLSAQGRRLLAAVGAPARPPRLRVGRTPPTAADIGRVLRRAAARPLAARPAALLSALLPEGATATTMISDGVASLLPDGWPTEPLWVCAVRRTDGRRVVFGRDSTPSLAAAVAASCAIPGVFTPVEIDGVAHVDGGAHSPTNADVLADRALALDLVLVSSPMSLSGRALRLKADQPVRRWARLLLDAEILRLRRRGIPVIALQPTPAVTDVMGPNAMDPTRRAAIADAARTSTFERLARPAVHARLAPLLD